MDSAEFTDHAVDLLKRDHYPNSKFSQFDPRGGPYFVDVSSQCYDQLSNRIHETFPKCNISQIHQVFAPHMYAIYMLRREEMELIDDENKVEELTLYHVTTESRALESLKRGLDWRCTQRAKFGWGVSFSDDADYANFFSDKYGEAKRVIMVCSVLCRKRYDIPEEEDGYSLFVPPDDADMTVSHSGRVYVKYEDNEFYPKYFVYYTRNFTESKYYRGNTRITRADPLIGLNAWMKAMNL